MLSENEVAFWFCIIFSMPTLVFIIVYLLERKYTWNSPGYIPLEDRLPPSDIEVTVEEFAEYKQKLKRRAWKWFIFYMLLLGPMIEVIAWDGGDYQEIQKEKLENLKSVEGIFFYYFSGKGRHIMVESGVKDAVTGKNIIKAGAHFCDDDKILKTYNGQPATAWYTNLPGHDNVLYIYQLKIGDKVVCDLETANKRVDTYIKERRRSFSIFRIGYLLNCFIIVGVMCYYLLYRINILKLYGEAE